jgi:hypothetical protein
MNHIDFLFYILGAIQLGELKAYVYEFGLTSKELKLLKTKVELVNATPFSYDPSEGYAKRDHDAYKLFVLIEWLVKKNGLSSPNMIDDIDRDILAIVEDSSVYSYGESSILYYFLGAYELCPMSNIKVTKEKLVNLTKLDKTDLYKNVMFLFNAISVDILPFNAVNNMIDSVLKQINVIEADKKRAINARSLEPTDALEQSCIRLELASRYGNA